MGTRKSTFVRIAILGCAALFGLGATFTWTGGGTDDDWDNCENWTTSSIGECSPDDANDDAVIDVGGVEPIDLVTTTIDDMTISAVVIFGAAEPNASLCVDSLTITAGGAASMTDGASIVARATSECPN